MIDQKRLEKIYTDALSYLDEQISQCKSEDLDYLKKLRHELNEVAWSINKNIEAVNFYKEKSVPFTSTQRGNYANKLKK